MQTAALDNGLRIIFHSLPSTVVYCGYVVCAGTRHERTEDAGMAHFIEHMSFKGTERRRSRQVNDYLECVGGDLNAYTGKQETVYSATILGKDLGRAVDLLTDMVFHSTYPQTEIEKEVEVIIDEIESYRDSPSELIFDDFEHLLYGDTPLGRDILGNERRLREYTTADAKRFADQFYRPDNTIFYAYGDLNEQKLLRYLSKAHAATVTASPVTCLHLKESTHNAPLFSPPTTLYVKRGTHQAHVVMGAPTFGSNDERRFSLFLLNNILGGPGMNSRLNLSVREHHGLAYSIDAYLNSYPDSGFWNIYFGCDIADVGRCRKLVEHELKRLAEHPLTPRQLKVAQEQLCGQIGISCDNSEAFAVAMAKQYAHFGTLRDMERLYAGIRNVTAEDLTLLAKKIYSSEKISTLIYR